jgi:hypothetical protein
VLSIFEWPNNSWTAPGTPVDQRGLGPAQRMGPEHAGIETDGANPVADEACILPGRYAPAWPARRSEQKVAGLSVRGADLVIDRLPRVFGHLEPHRHAGLFLARRCALDGVSVRRNVFHLEGDDIATAQLAVDCQIEHRQVATCGLRSGLSGVPIASVVSSGHGVGAPAPPPWPASRDGRTILMGRPRAVSLRIKPMPGPPQRRPRRATHRTRGGVNQPQRRRHRIGSAAAAMSLTLPRAATPRPRSGVPSPAELRGRRHGPLVLTAIPSAPSFFGPDRSATGGGDLGRPRGQIP